VRRYEEIEVEISDEFRKLAQPHPWADDTLEYEMYDRCVKAVEQATGMKVDIDEDLTAMIECVWSAENDELMLEV
jgi:hypothetical protein